VAGYISTMEDYPIALMYKPGKTNRTDALSRWLDFAPDPYNNKPVLALPDELFVQPNAPVINIGTYAYSAAKCPTHTRSMTFEENTEICVYNMDDEIHTSLVDHKVIAAQATTLKSLHQWVDAHSIEQ
jgi:hypothetical protein